MRKVGSGVSGGASTIEKTRFLASDPADVDSTSETSRSLNVKTIEVLERLKASARKGQQREGRMNRNRGVWSFL